MLHPTGRLCGWQLRPCHDLFTWLLSFSYYGGGGDHVSHGGVDGDCHLVWTDGEKLAVQELTWAGSMLVRHDTEVEERLGFHFPKVWQIHAMLRRQRLPPSPHWRPFSVLKNFLACMRRFRGCTKKSETFKSVKIEGPELIPIPLTHEHDFWSKLMVPNF